MKHTFIVENIKCGGCMNSIRKGLLHLQGVQDVAITKEEAKVEVEADEFVSAETIAESLRSMGYPIQGENTLFTQAKSYVSCMIGRMD
ncbi:MAG: heavy-metal-associated domain-containing protein [Chitinophagales bacterium]|nr:heavy-metal-associated domain-containing protein [Chitinophagales bacterium]